MSKRRDISGIYKTFNLKVYKMIKNNNIYGCGCGKPKPISKPKK